MAAVPDGAACYFCLGEEADDEGKPLVRDCSCRGDSSGFAHFSCLTKYAEQKSRSTKDGEVIPFDEPWEICNYCKQPFQNQLAVDLASAFVTFAEANYSRISNNKWDKLRILESLRLKSVVLPSMLCETDNSDNKIILLELKNIVNLSLSIIDQTKKDLIMSRWIHMPKTSDQYIYYKLLCGRYEAFAYNYLGALLTNCTDKDWKLAITHYKKAQAIYNLVDMKDHAQQIESKIALITSEIQAANNGSVSSASSSKSTLQTTRVLYEDWMRVKGINSEETIMAGLNYASTLWTRNCNIEAERLATTLSTVSHRVHGPHHKTTIRADEILDRCKERFVIFDKNAYQALRYENDGEICVVQGPIILPRNVENERMYRVNKQLVWPAKGCVVICHGLVSASHLNGELGQVVHMKEDETGIRIGVTFEKKSLKSALVKQENLRIAFELPNDDKKPL
jgi:hypothetical protein